MWSTARRSRLGLACVLVCAVATTLLRCGNDQDEFMCEQAVAKLVKCCPGFRAKEVSCVYKCECGCGGMNVTTHPAIISVEAQCILDEPCDELQRTDVCKRAQESTPTITGDDRVPSDSGDAGTDTGLPSSRPQVCP